jgi:hypothetical protein
MLEPDQRRYKLPFYFSKRGVVQRKVRWSAAEKLQ